MEQFKKLDSAFIQLDAETANNVKGGKMSEKQKIKWNNFIGAAEGVASIFYPR